MSLSVIKFDFNVLEQFYHYLLGTLVEIHMNTR